MVKSRVCLPRKMVWNKGRNLLDQKMNPIDEEFASFVRIKEVFLDEEGLEKEIITVKKMDPMIQCWDEEEGFAEL